MSNFQTNQPFLIAKNQLESVVQAEITPEMVAAKRAERMPGTWTAETRDGVAIIHIDGPITRYDSFISWLYGGVSIEDLGKDFTAAVESTDVSAIVLNIDSPGGEANGVNEFADMVYAARKKKKVVAYVGGMAASAGYWIASAASKIYIDETAELGSIGVVFAMRKKNDNMIEIVSANAPNKRPEPGSEGWLGEILGRANALEEVFISKVAKHRGVTEEKVKTDFGKGGIMVGQAALDAGLADHISSFEKVMKKLTPNTGGIFHMAEGNLKTKLAQLIFVDEENAKAALASLGYVPREAVTASQDVNTEEIEAAARAAGVEEGKAAAMAGVKEVMEKCVLGKVSDPALIKELVSLSPDDAGVKIMEAQASSSPAINSHRNPMNDGGTNPTIEACKRLAQEV